MIRLTNRRTSRLSIFVFVRTYNQIKQFFAVEPYLLNNLPKHQRSALAQIRMGILPLLIETGRYQNIPEQNRLCVTCEKIESEFHFICECKKYNDKRSILFELYAKKYLNFVSLSMQQKFVFLLQNSNKWLAQYIIDSMLIRSKDVYK